MGVVSVVVLFVLLLLGNRICCFIWVVVVEINVGLCNVIFGNL